MLNIMLTDWMMDGSGNVELSYNYILRVKQEHIYRAAI